LGYNYRIMLRFLAVFAVLLSISSLAHPQVPRNGSQKNKPAQSDNEQRQPSSQPCIGNTQIQPSSTEQTQATEQKPYQWRELYAPANLPNWGLVAVGLWAAATALSTLRFIRTQTELMTGQLSEIKSTGEQTASLIKHAEIQAGATSVVAEAAARAANVALASANAYQTAERAWMVNTEIKWSRFFNSTAGDSMESVSGTMFTSRWINSGHTPAFRCSSFATRQSIQGENIRNQAIPTFETPPEAEAQHPVPIGPGNSMSLGGIPFKESEIASLMKRESRLFLYNRTEYETVYSAARVHTEVCIEIEYAGKDATGNIQFLFHAVGPQNSAT
jgi:hypothetical protein